MPDSIATNVDASLHTLLNQFALQPLLARHNRTQWSRLLHLARKQFTSSGEVALYWSRWTPEQQFCWVYVLFECTQWRLKQRIDSQGPESVREFILQQIHKRGLESIPVIRQVLGIHSCENQLRLLTGM